MVEKSKIKIGITGAAGRMGSIIIREVCETPLCCLAAATEIIGHQAIGSDAGELAGMGLLSVKVTSDLDELFTKCDAVIDFSLPDAVSNHAAKAAVYGKALIIGTTGISSEQQESVNTASKNSVVIQAPNMSLSVNLLFKLAEQAASILDQEYDVEIIEMHHRKKIDSPSGTALGLGKAVARGRDIRLEDFAERGRDGITGERKTGSIGFASLRGGDVVGDHTVIFAANGERLELTHKAASRNTYARGAVRAALWAQDKDPGLYNMRDVLSLEKS